jgi:hypothetical protein
MIEHNGPGDAGAKQELDVKDLEVKDLEVGKEASDKVRGGKLYEATTKGTHIPEVVIE